jgi:Na+/H+ antiporter NhaD/arsenite permease-like protein
MLFLASNTATDVSPWMILPFAALLLSIALAPLLAPGFWHHHYPKVAAGLGLFTAAYYFFYLHAGDRLLHVGHEYISFVALIGSLFVIASGIHIVVKGESRPSTNVLFLFLGAVISNVIGTTGASMLLIRPWIRMNKYRITSFHIVFFIFVVSNVGGCLTPIGDPPLFLGYLRGVPFWWVVQNTWPMWLMCTALLLLVFYVMDHLNFRKAPKEVSETITASEEWKFQGLHNLLFVGVVLLAVLFNKYLPVFVPELLMLGAAVASFHTTPKQIHHANSFDFAPIKEVAWLFAGIFATMIPALDYLGGHAGELGIKTPHQFYWATGSLSAFLDNAPTYLTFLSAQLGLHHLNIDSTADVLAATVNFPLEIIAISVGAVFFGAMSYIGNGPNLMVKSISDHSKVKTPSFFGYMFRFSIPILLPILAIVGLAFFSKWRIF